MKKYGMIFASVIFTLLIMFLPSQKINAEDLEVKYLNYDKFETSYNSYSSKLETLRNYLVDYSNDYYYFIMFSNTQIYGYLVKKSNNVSISTILRSTDYASIYTYTGSTSKKISYIQLLTDLNNFDTNFDTFKTKVNNLSFTTDTALFGSSGIYNSYQEIKISNFILYDTNFDNYILNSDSVYALDVGGTIIQPGEKIPTYYKQKFSKSIDISSSFICDSTGKDAVYVTIDFSDYDTLGYSYQYGIQRKKGASIVWYDIEDIGNYIYNFIEYYNDTIIYARVLDNLGNEVVINEYRINNVELPKFALNISSSLGCPIPNYDGDPQAEIINVDFRNVYNENYKYYYYYDSKSKYEINLTSDNLIYQIVEYLYQFIYFEIRDENDNLIYYTYGNVSSTDRLGYFPDDYELRNKIIFNINPSCDRQGNEILNLQFDFSNITKYVNHYNFDVVINGEHLGAIQYHELVLDDSNYLDNLNYEVKIYIDTKLYASGNYSVGSSSSSFDDIYNDTLNDISSDSINNHDSLFNLFINALNHFRDVIVDIFNNCTYFFENLSPVLKYFYISVFILILFGFLIKFIL